MTLRPASLSGFVRAALPGCSLDAWSGRAESGSCSWRAGGRHCVKPGLAGGPWLHLFSVPASPLSLLLPVLLLVGLTVRGREPCQQLHPSSPPRPRTRQRPPGLEGRGAGLVPGSAWAWPCQGPYFCWAKVRPLLPPSLAVNPLGSLSGGFRPFRRRLAAGQGAGVERAHTAWRPGGQAGSLVRKLEVQCMEVCAGLLKPTSFL